MVVAESFPLDESILISRKSREGRLKRKKNFVDRSPLSLRVSILGAVLKQVKALIFKGSFLGTFSFDVAIFFPLIQVFAGMTKKRAKSKR